MMEVALYDPETGKSKSSMYEFGGHPGGVRFLRKLGRLSMGATYSVEELGEDDPVIPGQSRAAKTANTILTETGKGIGRFFATMKKAANPPDSRKDRRRDWDRARYEKALKDDRAVMNKMADTLKAVATDAAKAQAALAVRPEAKAAPPPQADVEYQPNDQADDDEGIAGWRVMRPLRRAQGERTDSWGEAVLDKGVVVRTAPGRRVGAVRLGNGLYLVGAVSEEVLRKFSPAEVTGAMERAAVNAISQEPSMAGPPSPWTRMLPMPPEGR